NRSMVDTDYVPSEKELSEDESQLRDVRHSYDEQYGFHDDDVAYSFISEKGLSENLIRQMSAMKNEPQWMLDIRLQAYEHFLERPMPTWGGVEMLNEIDFDDIYYYVRAMDKGGRDWDE